jgi:methionine-rich copper-binding protein CopC
VRAIRILLAAVVALVLGAAPALAHAPVKERTPKPGSTVSKVRTVSVRFGEAVVTGRIQVFRGSTELTAKTSGLKPANKAILRAVFARSLGKGSYKVKWRALADDGHHESGSWTFKVS